MTAITATPDITATPAEQTRPLKLSEAIRLGSIDTVQAHGTWSDTNAEGDATMCAMSTAWYALTGEHDASGTPLVRLLGSHRAKHPIRGDVMSIQSIIIDLNDGKKWSRAQIADWVESIGL